MLEQGCKFLLIVCLIVEVQLHRQVPPHLFGQPSELEGWERLLNTPDQELYG